MESHAFGENPLMGCTPPLRGVAGHASIRNKQQKREKNFTRDGRTVKSIGGYEKNCNKKINKTNTILIQHIALNKQDAVCFECGGGIRAPPSVLLALRVTAVVAYDAAALVFQNTAAVRTDPGDILRFLIEEGTLG